MTPAHVTARRSLFAAFAVCAATIAALAAPSSPSATAAPDPCAASQIAKTVGSVANSHGQPPGGQGILQTLQQPLTDLSGECKLPVTVPQILGLLQGAQQGGGLPGGLPGSLPGAQSVGMPGAVLPAGSSPASAVVQGTGPPPAPSAATTR